MRKIRAKAVCLFRHAGRILLAEGYDPAKDEHFFIPVGGGVDFGERAAAAARREVQEEIGAETTDFNLLGVSENIFHYNGKPGHEIVFVYEARFVNDEYYRREVIHGMESNGIPMVVRWVELARLQDDKVKIFPDGIKEML